MAEYMFREMLEAENIDTVDVESAGVAAQAGREASPPAVQVLKSHGINSIQMHQAKPVSELELSPGDLVLTMTKGHVHRMPEIEQADNIELSVLKEYVGDGGGFSDPFGGSVERYKELKKELEPILEELLETVKEHESIGQ